MNNKFDISDGKNKDFSNFCGWVSTLSIIGLGSSTFSLFFKVLRNTQWTLQLVCTTITPFVISALAYAIIAIVVKAKYNIIIHFVPKKWSAFLLTLAILYLALNLFQWNNNRKIDLPMINLSEISTISTENQEKDNGKYYLIFGSQNCTFCYQMEQIYERIHKRYPDMVLYYVDLTYEPLSKPEVKDRNITSIPSMVCYQNDVEVDRIEGLASYEMLVSFVDRGKGGE